jgi:hypothetical protein
MNRCNGRHSKRSFDPSVGSIPASKKPNTSSESWNTSICSLNSDPLAYTSDVVVPGRRKAFKYGTAEYKQVNEKLEELASAAGEDEKCDFGEGILIDVDVPLNWWQKTEIRRLPFKIVYHKDSKRLFAIEINGGSHHESLIKEIYRQLGDWSKSPAA